MSLPLPHVEEPGFEIYICAGKDEIGTIWEHFSTSACCTQGTRFGTAPWSTQWSQTWSNASAICGKPLPAEPWSPTYPTTCTCSPLKVGRPPHWICTALWSTTLMSDVFELVLWSFDYAMWICMFLWYADDPCFVLRVSVCMVTVLCSSSSKCCITNTLTTNLMIYTK